MKYFIILILLLPLFSNVSLAQTSCFGTSAVVSPNVTKPTGTSVMSSTCTSLSVQWQGTSGQNYCVRATYFNSSANKTDTVAGSNIVCNGTQSCTASIPVIVGAQVTWSVQAKDAFTGMVSYPAVNVLETPIRACSGTGIKFCGKVLLQGAYDTLAKQMRNDLNTQGILQSQASNQPYNNTAFGYTGTESVGTGFFAAHPDIVDWVLVELRDPNVPTTIVGRRAVFVKQNGTLVDTGGVNTQITFPALPVGTYHVAVRHRNHLGIRTVTPVDFSCGTACLDFTTGGSRTFKNQDYSSSTQITTSPWMMRGGDANVNKTIRYTGPLNDANQILNIKIGGSLSAILNNVYAPEDVNMNGNIRWTGPGNDQNFLLNIALPGLLSTVFTEQL